MKKAFGSIALSLLITLSFVVTVGIVSSAAVMAIENFEDHISAISGCAQLIFLIAAVLILRLRKINIPDRCGLSGASPYIILISVGAGFCFSAFSNILQEILPIPRALTGETADSYGTSVAAFIAAVYIVAPFVEEFVFRGLIMTKLREAVKTAPAILLSAFLFGAIHLMTGSAVTGIHAFLGGLIFGLAYEKSGSLFAAIAAHIAGNLGGLVPFLLQNASSPLLLITAVITGGAAIALCFIMIKQNADKNAKKG